MTVQELEATFDGYVVETRNIALGLWAGQKIGFFGRQLESYVVEVLHSDLRKPGPEDVIDKIHRDLVAHGHFISRDQVRDKLVDVERATRHQFATTD